MVSDNITSREIGNHLQTFDKTDFYVTNILELQLMVFLKFVWLKHAN